MAKKKQIVKNEEEPLNQTLLTEKQALQLLEDFSKQTDSWEESSGNIKITFEELTKSIKVSKKDIEKYLPHLLGPLGRLRSEMIYNLVKLEDMQAFILQYHSNGRQS